MYVDLQKQNLPFISECTGHKLRWPIEPNTFVKGADHSEVCLSCFGCVYLHIVFWQVKVVKYMGLKNLERMYPMSIKGPIFRQRYVLVPVSLRPPSRKAHSAVIGQLPQAWAGTAQFVPIWTLLVFKGSDCMVVTSQPYGSPDAEFLYWALSNFHNI